MSKPQLNVGSGLLTVGLALAGIGGGFAPWVWREAVAIQLTAPGLAEFVKFLPEIRTGQLDIERLYFLLPLFWAMLAVPLVVNNRQTALPDWVRWLWRLGVVPLALAALSPVWTPAILRASEFRLQTGLAGLAVGLALIAPLLSRLPLKLLAPLLTIGGAAALGLAGQQFSLLQGPLSDVYRGAVTFGWGWWLTVVGIMLSSAASLWLAFGVSNRDT